MSIDLAAFLLAVSAALILTALLGSRIFGAPLRTRAGKMLRGVLAIAGVALATWAAFTGLGVNLRPPSAAPAAVPQLSEPRGEPLPTATSQLENCSMPSPPAVPVGASATEAQMLTARAAFQAYDAAINAYTKCVDATIERVTRQFAGAAAVELQELRKLGTSAHNTAIDQEQAVADSLNAQVRAYKAKHPGS